MGENILNVICNRVLSNKKNGENVYQQIDSVLTSANSQYAEPSSDIRVGYYLKQYLNRTDVNSPGNVHLELFSRHLIEAMAEYAMYEIESTVHELGKDNDDDDTSESE